MRKKKFTKNVGVLLNEDVYQQLVAVTDEKEIPLSEYIRKLVEDEISKKEDLKNE
jgi:uncharacterized linocin/CFP29 family protein